MPVLHLFAKSIGVVLTLLTSFFVAVFSFCRTTSLSNSPRYVTAEFARQIPKNISQITSQERLKPLLPKTLGKPTLRSESRDCSQAMPSREEETAECRKLRFSSVLMRI